MSKKPDNAFERDQLDQHGAEEVDTMKKAKKARKAIDTGKEREDALKALDVLYPEGPVDPMPVPMIYEPAPFDRGLVRTTDNPLAEVRLLELVAMDKEISRQAVWEAISVPLKIVDSPVVVQREEKFYVYSGLDQVVAAKLRGDSTIMVRLAYA